MLLGFRVYSVYSLVTAKFLTGNSVLSLISKSKAIIVVRLKSNGGVIMPIVRVEMWPGRTNTQKAELARLITEAIVSVAHTTPDATTIIFEDVSKENWAIGGVLASDADR